MTFTNHPSAFGPGERVFAPRNGGSTLAPATVLTLERYHSVTVRFDGIPYPQTVRASALRGSL